MTIYLVVLMAFLSQAGFGGSRVAVSLHALQLTSNQFAIGLVIALYSLCPMLLSIVIGRFADRAPPRRLVVVGSVIMTVALLVPFFVPGLAVLCAAAFVLGFAHQVFSLPIEALVGGIGGPEKRARNYALITMSWSAANFAGPVMAGFSIDYLGQTQVYVVLAAFTLAPVAMLAFTPNLLPRKGKSHEGADVRGSVLELWRMPSLRITMIAAGIVGSAQDLFQFYMPIYGHSVGLSASAIGVVLGMFGIAAFFVRIWLPALVKRWGADRVFSCSLYLAAAAFLMFPLFSSALALSAVALVIGLGMGCAQPVTLMLVYSRAPEGRSGEALGMRVTINQFTHIVVPIVFGTLGSAFGVAPVFLVNALILAGGGVLNRGNSRAPDKRPSPPG